MSRPASPRHLLADGIALRLAIDREAGLDPEERRGRDRDLAADWPAEPLDLATAGSLWLDRVSRLDPELAETRQGLTSAVGWTGFAAGAGGLVLGWAAAATAFFFEGSGRVNVFLVLGLLVLLPLVLLLPWVLAALPARLTQWIPAAPLARDLHRHLNPGRWAAAAVRVFPNRVRAAWTAALSPPSHPSTALSGSLAGLAQWAFLRWSQVFAVAFQSGALLAALALVVFTDLAFGWSTTLTTGDPARDAAWLESAIRWGSVPWSWAVESARPSVELIRESRFFRASTGHTLGPEAAARLGAWWPFVLLTMLVYGLLPRLLTLAVSSWQLRAAARATLAETPGLAALLRRLHQARVATEADTAEPAPGPNPPAARAASPNPLPGGSPVSAVINWAAAPVDHAYLSARFPTAPVFPAGGGSPLEADTAAIHQVAQALRQNPGGEIAILVRAWEPPLHELFDFLRDLRQAVGRERTLVIVPLGEDPGGRPAEPDPGHHRVWAGQAARAGDPWLVVAAPAEAATR